MERASSHALPLPLQPSHADEWAVPQRQMIARAALQVRDELSARLTAVGEMDYPHSLDGRGRDLWLPALALGEALGEPYTTRFREACIAMSNAAASDVTDYGELLLLHCHRYFDENGTVTATPTELVSWLVAQESAPWSEYRHGRDPISTRGVALLLERFGIRSATPQWHKGRKERLFRRSDFVSAFARYLAIENDSLPVPVLGAVPSVPSVDPSRKDGTLGTDGTDSGTGEEKASADSSPCVSAPVLVTLHTGQRFETSAGDRDLELQRDLSAETTPLPRAAAGPGGDAVDDGWWLSVAQDAA